MRVLPFITSFFLIGSFVSAEITPGTPVPITNTGTINSMAVVAGTSSGYITTCLTTDSTLLISGFSSDMGASWIVTSTNTSAFELLVEVAAWVAGTGDSFVASPVLNETDFFRFRSYAWFSSNDGMTWPVQSMTNSEQFTNSDVAQPALVAWNSSGYMVTWFQTSTSNFYTRFSADGMTWGSMMPVDTSSTGNSALGIGASSTGFLTAWQDTSQNAQGSFSMDNGMTWSSKVQINTVGGNVLSNVLIGSNSSGFMVTWTDNGGNGYSSFSSDSGMTWSPDSTLATNVATGTDVYVSGFSEGFVASWIGSDNNAYASLSMDNGSTWSTPVAITSDGSVASTSSNTVRGFVSVSAVGDNCMFTWLNQNDSNAYSSYAALMPGPPPPPPSPPSSGSPVSGPFFHQVTFDAPNNGFF